MKNKALVLSAILLAGATGCSSLGQLTVREYTASNGKRVTVGEAEPKEEYACVTLGEEEGDWGLVGAMSRTGAITRITDQAIEKASQRGSNYVFIDTPAEVGVLGLNVNAFSDADVTYYRCENLPSAGGQ